jgi:MoaA/NifB/PqqE/SkfB family radical SAM enzyme
MQRQVDTAPERLDFIWLELTGRCNLECVHCYADSGPRRPLAEGMDTEDWLAALDQAAALGCRKVQFIGGEPTLHPGLPQLIRHARERGYEQVCVYTNGTHFTEALKTVFLEQRVSLAFSIYGSSSEVHDSVTLRRGSFARTERAWRWAVGAGLPVHVGVIAMQANAHEVAETERRLRAAGVGSVYVDRLRGFGRGARERPGEPQLRELCGRCGDRKLCIGSDGKIHPCTFARSVVLGRAARDGLARALGGPLLHEFRHALIDAHAHSDPRAACAPEEPAPPCTPERDPGPCNPEIPPPDCQPEKPSICHPEQAAYYQAPAGLDAH